MNQVFQALSDPTRREILRLLKQRDMTAGELAAKFPLAKSTLSSHFNVLKHAGLVVFERQGSSLVYSLNLSAFEEALGGLIELFDLGTRKRSDRRTPARKEGQR
jgi:ArsR family transcriptional regulator